MGGNAFPNYCLARLNAEDYVIISNEIVNRLRSNFPDSLFEVIPSYRSKDSFGDLDILYCSDVPRDSLKNCISPVDYVYNGDVSSFAVEINDQLFQVDLIKSPRVSFDFALSYFSYNDLGNLLGRVFRRGGLKLGHRGLTGTRKRK